MGGCTLSRIVLLYWIAQWDRTHPLLLSLPPSPSLPTLSLSLPLKRDVLHTSEAVCTMPPYLLLAFLITYCRAVSCVSKSYS